MYKKIMLSAAAAMTLTTAGMAFDTTTNNNGLIVTTTDNSTLIENGYSFDNNYNIKASNKLQLSDNQYGDAIIYPTFTTEEGYNTEITVRNTNKNAVVAKAVLYSADTSEEILDFNIYLSGHDVFRFTIADENGKTTLRTNDKSIVGKAIVPQDAVKNTVTQAINDNTAIRDLTKAINTDKGAHNRALTEINRGYVVIYGMTQVASTSGTVYDVTDTENFDNTSYHNMHPNLMQDYRNLLDNCRDGWRQAYSSAGNMVNGMMTKNLKVHAPDIKTDGLNGSCAYEVKTNESSDSRVTFESVSENALAGSVRIYKTTDKDRDMILQGTAVKNFTDTDQSILWTEGEYASFGDRQIIASGANQSAYDAPNVLIDSQTFIVDTINPEFFSDYNETDIIVTQPYKRLLVQLNEDNGIISGSDITASNLYSTDCSAYGKFKLASKAIDTNEKIYTDSASNDVITSPYSSEETTSSHCNEMAVFNRKDLNLNKAGYEDGHAYIKASDGYQIRGIVTQMNGKLINASTGDEQTNWFYAPVK